MMIKISERFAPIFISEVREYLIETLKTLLK